MEVDPQTFLIAEFEQCFEHKRHLQNQRQALIGLYFAVLFAIPVAFGLIKNQQDQCILLSLIYIAGIMMFGLLVLNRKYTATVTRQINGLRNYFISRIESSYIKSIYPAKYLDKNYPPFIFDVKSYSFIVFCLICLLNSLVVSSIAYISLNNLSFLLVIAIISIGVHILLMLYFRK